MRTDPKEIDFKTPFGTFKAYSPNKDEFVIHCPLDQYDASHKGIIINGVLYGATLRFMRNYGKNTWQNSPDFEYFNYESYSSRPWDPKSPRNFEKFTSKAIEAIKAKVTPLVQKFATEHPEFFTQGEVDKITREITNLQDDINRKRQEIEDLETKIKALQSQAELLTATLV